MNSTLTLPSPDLRIWAGQHLEVSPEASPREARGAYLRKLADYQWLPPAAIEESHEYWVRPAGSRNFPSLAEQAYQDEEYRLRVRVDHFAGTYFDVRPIQRQARYRALVEECAWSANLSARLRSLAAGLDLDRRDWHYGGAAVADLAQHLCQLFTLPQAERGRRRWRILEELQAPANEGSPQGRGPWMEAARVIEERHPDLASLEPTLIDELAWERSRRRRQARLPQMAPAYTSQPSSSGGGSKWYIWLIVVVIGVVVRAATSTRSTPPPPPPPPPQLPAAQQWNQQDILQRRFQQLPPPGKQGQGPDEKRAQQWLQEQIRKQRDKGRLDLDKRNLPPP